MKRIILASMIILCGAVSALADWDTLVFEDTVKPHGQERGDTERNADLLACGSTSNFEIDTSKIPAAVRFMRRHGWHLYETRHTKTWIDPDTGGTCYNGSYMGIPSVQCTPGDHSD